MYNPRLPMIDETEANRRLLEAIADARREGHRVAVSTEFVSDGLKHYAVFDEMAYPLFEHGDLEVVVAPALVDQAAWLDQDDPRGPVLLHLIWTEKFPESWVAGFVRVEPVPKGMIEPDRFEAVYH